MDTQNLLQDILGSDNTVRSRAETQLNTQRTANPSALLSLFVENMNNEKVEVAQISCVLFKKYFLDNSEGITNEHYLQMKDAVLNSLDFQNQNMLLLKRKGDLISKVFMLLGQSEDLLRMLVEWAQSADANSKQFAMYVFEKQTECHLSAEQLKTHQDGFYTVFQNSMKDSDAKVRVAALRATASFVLSVEDEAILTKFKTLVPLIFETTVDAIKSDQYLGKQALESLVNVSQTHSQFLKDHISQLVKITSDVVKMKDFEEGTRSQAAEIVLTMAEQVPALLRKESMIQTEFFPALIQLLTECEQDMDTWNETTEDEEATGNDIYSAGVSSIERLSKQMMEKVTLASCGPVIGQCLQQGDWNVRQAGYMTSGLISEACSKHMKTNMDTAFQTACAGIKDDHPRVKYAGLYCLSSLLVQLKPMAQKKYHAELVPALLDIINNQSMVAKVRTQAVQSLYYFTVGLIEEDDNEINETKKSSEIIASYSDNIAKSLIVNLTSAVKENNEPMQEQILNLLNALATLIEEKFALYFKEFMPLMEEILDKCESSTQNQMRLRARAIESIGYMITSVSENKEFLDVVQRVTEKLFKLVDQEFSQDDPQEYAIKDTLAKTAYYLKEDFHVVAPKFLQILAKDAQVEIKVANEDADLPQTQNASMNSFNLKLRGMENGIRFSLNTSELENKIAAFNHILMVAEAMGTAFEQYVADLLPILYSHMNYTSRTLRKSCLKTFQYLLVAKGEGSNLALFREIYKHFALHIVSCTTKEDIKSVKLLFKELYHCMRVISENEEEQNKALFETPGELATFGQLMNKSLQTVLAKKGEKLIEIQEKQKQAEIDEEDIKQIEKDLDKISGAAIYINECCTTLMGVYKQDVTKVLDDNVKFYFGTILQDYKNVTPQELQDATFFFITYVDNCNNTDSMMLYELCNQFIEITLWADVDMISVRQNTVYGIGTIAKYLSKEQFSSLLPNTMKAVDHVTSFEKAQDEEHLVVTENAYITLGVLAMHQTHDQAHLGKFLELLPLQGEEEAQEAHELLLDQLLAGNQALNAVKPQVQQALTKISQKYSEDDSILTEEAKEKLDKVMGMM